MNYSFFERQFADKVFGALDGIETGALTLITPDGRTRTFEGRKDGPTAHLHVHRWQVFSNLIFKGDIGFADDYRNGLWDCDDLTALVELALLNRSACQDFVLGHGVFRTLSKLRYILNLNTIRGSKNNIHAHYDLGNSFYKLWLDPSMTYSSALFKGDEDDLMSAQNNKYDRILDVLGSSSGDLLEVGCGWGGFAERAVAKSDFNIKGITLSEEQHQFARERLKTQANIALEDYRHQKSLYDQIVSIEMFEAVGEKFWPVYFQKLKSLLKQKGRAVLQTITINEHDFATYRNGADFIRSYIFPGGMLPSLPRFQQEASKAGLKTGSVHAFGQDYARTMTHWLDRFDDRAEDIKALGFDEGFMRLWRFYLAACIAGFKVGRTDVVQIELAHV